MDAPIGGEWEARTVRGVGPHPHDPRAFVVAELVMGLIAQARPGTLVEHVGSTAVAGLAGKGTVDLQISAEPQQVPEISARLVELGFSRQIGPRAWPATRPMLVGTFRFDGAVFGLHCHVVPTDDPNLGQMPAFRDLLRRRPELCAAYAAEKRRIAQGTDDVLAYTEAKTNWINVASTRPPND